jgi:hypothetical protein
MPRATSKASRISETRETHQSDCLTTGKVTRIAHAAERQGRLDAPTGICEQHLDYDAQKPRQTIMQDAETSLKCQQQLTDFTLQARPNPSGARIYSAASRKRLPAPCEHLWTKCVRKVGHNFGHRIPPNTVLYHGPSCREMVDGPTT